MRLKDRVVLIKGASRGISRVCALACARQRANVMVAAKTEVADNPRLPGTIHDVVQEIYATMNFGLGGPESWRKADVLADAALSIITKEPSLRGGEALVDESVLREDGETDFSKYPCVPGTEPPRFPVAALPRAVAVKG